MNQVRKRKSTFEGPFKNHPFLKCLLGYVILIALVLIICPSTRIERDIKLIHNSTFAVYLANNVIPLTFFVMGYYVWEAFDFILLKLKGAIMA